MQLSPLKLYIADPKFGQKDRVVLGVDNQHKIL